MSEQASRKPFRVGIFRTAAEAIRAIHALLEAGFKRKELAVVCADQSIEWFRDIPHPNPPAHDSDRSLDVASTAEAVLGGAALAAAALASGGFGVPGGQGALVEGEALLSPAQPANEDDTLRRLYTKAVKDGHVLLAVEVTDEDAAPRLALAEQLLTENGSDPSLASE